MAGSKHNYSFSIIITNIWQEPLLRSILLVSFFISLALPGFSIFYLVPEFSSQLIANVEDEAQRTAEYMIENIFPGGDLVIPLGQMEQVDRKIETARRAMLLDKVKVFTNTGNTIYSTDKQDLGEINNKDYFNAIVRQGKIYSKVVNKNFATSEGRITGKDVAEVYIPMRSTRGFSGAFEIYYDITVKKAELKKLIAVSSVLSITVSVLLLLMILLVLYRASKASVRRRLAEEEVRRANNSLEERVLEQTYELQITQNTSIEALAILAESYDADTGAHLARIQRYVECLTSAVQNQSLYVEYLAGKENYVEEVTLASLLHDIGKTAVPQDILTKQGRLTAQEFDIVKKHTTVAGKILGRANQSFSSHFGKDSYLAFARDIALHHHEKWDGTGYPHQLKGKEIPLSARIVSLADVYDALRSRRPYKEPWPHADAMAEIIRCCGSQFDPELVDIFIANTDRIEEIANLLMPTSEHASVINELSPADSAPAPVHWGKYSISK